ncbi:mobilization protein [Vibrio parahaemolyticus]|nr:mobilization protein [Vibrio parahaemolyticus]
MKPYAVRILNSFCLFSNNRAFGNALLSKAHYHDKELFMLLTTREERDQANQKNRKIVLNFLLLHRYSTLKNIAFELGHKSTASASRILKRLCHERLVKKEVIKEEFINVTLFGITQNGIDEVGVFVDEHQPFYKSRVSLRNLKHTVANQRAGTIIKRHLELDDLMLINTEFGNLTKYKSIVDFKHRPDLLVVGKLPSNGQVLVFAVETELSLKDTKRYRKIWLEYLSKVRAKKLNQVWYCVKDDAAKSRLTTLWDKEKKTLLMDNERDFISVISMKSWLT